MEPADAETDVPAEPDPELWRKAAGGDRSAFGELFERHVQAVWNHAYRLTGSWSLAEDIASIAFLTAWRRRTEITLARDSALPWLYAVVGNLARAEQRRSIRFRLAVRRLPVAGVDHDHADAVAGRVSDDQRLRVVLDAVRGLPRSERQVVELCLIGGVSTADAAVALGIGEASVRSRISRARGRLRAVVMEES